MDLLQIVTLALMQGLTEFLPISTSAHLVLPTILFGLPPPGLLLDVATHAGSLFAVLVHFRGDLAHAGAGVWRAARSGVADVYVRLFGQVLTATLPILALGVALRDWVEPHPRPLFLIAATTVGFALLMGVADARSSRPGTTEFELSWRDALLIGLLQMLAIVPGTSRAGITITAGLLLGLSREAAARFAFLLAIPTLLGTTLLGAVGAARLDLPVNTLEVGVGFVASAAASYATLHLFLKWVERTGLMPYVTYLLVLGAVLVGVGLSRG